MAAYRVHIHLWNVNSSICDLIEASHGTPLVFRDYDTWPSNPREGDFLLTFSKEEADALCVCAKYELMMVMCYSQGNWQLVHRQRRMLSGGEPKFQRIHFYELITFGLPVVQGEMIKEGNI